MPPGKKRVSKAPKINELNLGDLVLAKVKGFPAWPAKISRPEDFKQSPDPKKFFVKFYGTAEIAFVVPADVQAFTTETKNNLSARCKGKTVKYFAQAVQEICKEFEELQGENLSGVTDHNRFQNRESETCPLTPAVDKAVEVKGDDLINSKEPDCKLENEELAVLGSVSGDRTQGDMDCKNIKLCSSQEANRSLSPHISSGRRNELSENPVESVSVSSPSNHPHPKEESRDIKAEGRYPSVANKLTNGNQSKTVRAKKKSEGAKHMNTDSAHSCDHSVDGMKIKNSSHGNMKILSPPDNLRSALKDGCEKKEKKKSKDKRALEAADDNPVDMDLNAEEKINVLHRKKMKLQHGFKKQRFQPAEGSCLAQISKCADTEEASIARPQMSRKKGSSSISNVDGKTTAGETKRLKPGGKTEDHMAVKVKANANEFNHCTDEVALPPTKRHCRSLQSLSSSASISENKSGSPVAVKTNSLTPNKSRSPVIQLPTKRRAVLRCDDDEDELQLPKTPVHGGFSSKVSAVPRVSSSKKKPVISGERFVPDKMVSRNPGTVDDVVSKQVKSAPMSNLSLLSPPERDIEKRSRESSIMHVSPSPSQLDTEKLPVTDTKPVASTPKMSPNALIIPPESQNKQSSKAFGNTFQNKAPVGANYALASVTETSTSSMSQTIGGRSKENASVEKMKSTIKLDLRINLVEGNLNGYIFSPGDRLDIGREDKTSIPIDSKNSDTLMSMKNLIAAAQLRKKQAHIQNSSRGHIPFLVPDADRHGWSLSPTDPTPASESESGCTLLQGLHPTSPSYDILQLTSSNQHENEELMERRVSSGHQATGISLSGGTEGAVARDAFEGMIETLSRTKESIGRATRLAIDCAKYGIANEVVELLIKKLETETSFHRRVDLFFLVDSITQCSHSQKGIAGASYIPIVQAALPRLVGAAAPTGAGAQENRRQCRKVLRLWLERKILPESVLRRFIDDMGSNDDTSASGFQHRRPSRSERAIDDPIREMEGMFVDEYGSNAAFPLPGLLASRLFEEEDDEDDFPKILGNEVVDGSPSKHSPTSSIDPEHAVTPSDRRHCILEDVDGELEMEDVSGNQKDEKTAFISGTVDLGPKSDQNLESSNIHEELLLSPDSPPLPPGSPPRPPPPPSSPPPRPPPESSPAPPPPPSQNPLPPPPYAGLMSHMGPPLPIHPPLILQQPLQQQPSFTPQQMQHALPSTVGNSLQSAYQPPLLDYGVAPTVNQHVPMVPNSQTSHFDAPRRSDIIPQQLTGFPSAGFSNMQEKNGFNPPRPVEYKQNDIYMNTQALQNRQSFLPGGAPFAQRPLQPEHPPVHFSYPNSAQPYQYPPYSLPNSSDGSRRNASDEQWRMQVNEFNADGTRAGWMAGGPGPSYSHEGYFGPPIERPLVGAVTPIPVHGVQMMPPRPGMSAISWRPA